MRGGSISDYSKWCPVRTPIGRAGRALYFASVALIAAGVACGGIPSGDIEGTSREVIIGADGRQDPFSLGFEPRYHTESDVAIWVSSFVIDQGNGTSALQTQTFGPFNNLCSSERFFNQPIGVPGQAQDCSGFLVAPDVVATAGHCVGNPGDSAASLRFIFHYRMDSATTARTVIPNQDIFSGVVVIDKQPVGLGDWALVKLDRVVDHRRMAPMRQSGTIATGQSLLTVGHPSGLPYKYADGGTVVGNADPFGFNYGLDVYRGNSGSMVVNTSTREVEGIHSQGSQPDFVAQGSCNVSNTFSCEGLALPCESTFATRTTNFADRISSGVLAGTSATYFVNANGGSTPRADLIAVKWDGVKVRTSNGSSFGSSANWTSNAFYGMNGTYFADVTGDGKVDAIAVGGVSSITVRRANSTGTAFSTTEENWAPSGNFLGQRGQYFRDVTGDGRADLIMVNNDSIKVRRANSSGTAFSSTEEVWSNVAYFGRFGTFFADVTGDGKADAIVVGDSNVVVRRANSSATGFNGNETWISGPFFGSGGTFFADVTGDGKADAIVVNSDNITIRRANAGATAFGANEPWSTSGFFGSYGTFFADVTGDGKADVIVVNGDNVTVRAANSGGTAFSTASAWLTTGDHGTVGAVFASLR